MKESKKFTKIILEIGFSLIQYAILFLILFAANQASFRYENKHYRQVATYSIPQNLGDDFRITYETERKN